MRQAPLVRNHRENSVNKEVLEIVGNGKLTCSEEDNCSFRHDMNKRAKSTQPNPSPRSSTQQSVKNASRTRSPRGRTQVGKWLDCFARIDSKELAPVHAVQNGIPRSACSTRQKMDADLGKSALMRIARLMYSLAKGLKRMVTKVQWLHCKLHDNLVVYSRIWSRRSLQRFCGRAQTY